MNTLRRSFISSLIQDESLKAIDVTFSELQKIVHLIFIAGEDYQLSDREKDIVESKINKVKDVIKIYTNKNYFEMHVSRLQDRTVPLKKRFMEYIKIKFRLSKLSSY